MLEMMLDSAGNILAFRASGTITLQDFRQCLVPRLQAAVAAGGSCPAPALPGGEF